MEIFYYIAAFLIIRRLSRSLRFSLLRPKWKAMLTTATWVLVVGYMATAIWLEDPFKHLIGSAVLLGLVYYFTREQDFASQRSYLLANIPLAAMGLVNFFFLLFFDEFYDKYGEYFSGATLI